VDVPEQPAELYPGDIKSVLLSSEAIQTRIAELGAKVGEDYRGTVGSEDLLLVTVLKGAVMFVTDLSRAIPLPTQLEFMAVSSYGSSTSSSPTSVLTFPTSSSSATASTTPSATATCPTSARSTPGCTSSCERGQCGDG
jgi:hypoxanthine-guanine phosphoribosyltransferase